MIKKKVDGKQIYIPIKGHEYMKITKKQTN